MIGTDAEIRKLSNAIAEMGGVAEANLSRALDALAKRDASLAAEVIQDDKRLDRMEKQVDELAVRILMMRQPMARDLRAVIAGLKIASTLERVGDMAKNTAKRAQILAEGPAHRSIGPVVRMGRQSLQQLTQALDAYANGDLELAQQVWRRDVEVDELYNSVFRELLTYMMEDPRTIGACAQLMFVAKNIERIGDHATFIAEMTNYVVSAEAPPPADDRPKAPLEAGFDELEESAASEGAASGGAKIE